MRRALGGLLMLVALSGCAAGTSPGAGPSQSPLSSSASPSAVADPTDLIGLWTVTDAGEQRGAVLRLAADSVSLWRACGHLEGSWRATREGLFVATTFAGDGSCASDGSLRRPRWLESAARFRVRADAVELLDSVGAVTARLVRGGSPTAGPGNDPELAAPPTVDPSLREAFADPPALPSGVRAASRDALVGSWAPLDVATWVRAHPANTPPGVTFEPNGDYRDTDGCNGGEGRWAVGGGGQLIATFGISTVIGCDNVDVGEWVATAARAGFDGSVPCSTASTARRPAD
jgi:hypothetical protein